MSLKKKCAQMLDMLRHAKGSVPSIECNKLRLEENVAPNLQVSGRGGWLNASKAGCPKSVHECQSIGCDDLLSSVTCAKLMSSPLMRAMYTPPTSTNRSGRNASQGIVIPPMSSSFCAPTTWL